MISKLLYLLIPIVGLTFGSFFQFPSQHSSSQQNLKHISGHLSVINFGAPASLDFAGEEVPLQNPQVRQKLDREISRYVKHYSGSLVLLKRANRYRDTFLKILRAKGVPEDFFYLAVAESNLTNASSPVGAQGFWQFMENTAREHGLEVSATVDERYHPEKSTSAAASYLLASYRQFQDWALVAAAYNMGGPGLSRSMKQQTSDSYYGLKLNKETSRYMYRILGYKCILDQPDRYGFAFEEKDLYQPIAFKVVKVSENINDLRNFAEQNGSTYSILKNMNPWLISDHLDVQPGKVYEIRFPLNSEVNAGELLLQTTEGYDSSEDEAVVPEMNSGSQHQSEQNTEVKDEPKS
ncbi:MAG: lytic transglycosylase domain-containing protein [Bacteroidia bacterium]|nr:lytic transglycosylase domain-containing protein [Bacteroidia bacterium]